MAIRQSCIKTALTKECARVRGDHGDRMMMINISALTHRHKKTYQLYRVELGLGRSQTRTHTKNAGQIFDTIENVSNYLLARRTTTTTTFRDNNADQKYGEHALCGAAVVKLPSGLERACAIISVRVRRAHSLHFLGALCRDGDVDDGRQRAR